MNERVAEVYSLMIPLQEGRLLVPRSCVAEVIGHQTPQLVSGTPPWYLGTINWSNNTLPLVSFEAACGQTLPQDSARTRIVVMNTVDDRLEGANYALVAQGFPQLLRVSADVIRADPGYARIERHPVLCRVRMLKDSPLIPDLEMLETMIADETSVRAN
jgi:chemosensory pili system protein ChpC